jgi:hypothetical protein
LEADGLTFYKISVNYTGMTAEKKYQRPIYYAANSYEGCGHKHRSAQGAVKCAERMNMHYAVHRKWLKAKIFMQFKGEKSVPVVMA